MPAIFKRAAIGMSFLAVALAVPSSAMASTVQVGPAVAIPASASSCNPDPVADVSECTAVSGSGDFIGTLSGHARGIDLVSNEDRLHIQLYVATTNDTIKNCGTFNLTPTSETGPTCTWSAGDEASGQYCSRVWKNNGNNNFSALSSECINVS